LTRGTELRNIRIEQPIVKQLGHYETARTLTEVSIAALTTEPELHDIGRALITLARYHATRMQAVMTRA